MKRMLGIVLILIVLAALTPLYCFADEKTCNNGGDLLLSGNGGNDYTTYTLGDSCNNITIADISISGEVSLDLNGKILRANAIKCLDQTSPCSLEIKGSGTLTVNDSIRVNYDLTISGGTVTTNGIIDAVNIIISGGTVTAEIIPANLNINISGGTVTTNGIDANGYITISGGTVTTNGSINAQNDITISSGQVTVNGSSNSSYGIRARNDITISGGTVTVTGSPTCGINAENDITISGEDTQVMVTGSSTYSINADNGITISGGTVTVNGSTGSSYGINADNGITISGGTVTVTGSPTFGIYAINGITISGGTVTVTGSRTYGIYAKGITISGQDTQVTATATGSSGCGIYADAGSITISGATVTEASGGYYGIYASQNITIEKGGTVKEVSGGTYGIYTPKGTITISGTVTASGNEQAVKGSVKNTVRGIGWTDAAGTQGITSIQTTEQDPGQDLTSYKKVRFPAETGDVTFKVVNGAWGDGTTGDKTGIVYSTDGTTWTLPEDQIPAVDKSLKGNWDTDPSTATPITPGKTYTYTYKDKAAVTTAPTARDLTYSGKAQELVTAGTASGGTMQYALGTSTEPTGGWSSSIPTGTGVETYYVWYKAVGDTDHNDSVSKCVQVRIKEADDLKSDVIQNRLTSVPAELAEIYSDFSKLQNALMAELRVNGEPAQIGQTAFYDVILLISTDGINWVKATEENFPKGGLWVLLDYPEGTGKDTHDFSVSHMFTVTSARLGTTKGDVEYPVFEKTDKGLQVKLTGLSPVAIAWREIKTPGPERPGIDFFRLYGDCELPATGFSSLRPTVLPERPKDLRYEPVQMHLMLPTLDREIELVTMPRERNSWAAAWLGADAGILEGSALPGEGLSIIAGHNTLNDTDYGPFALLSTLEVNDTVIVRDENGALKLFRVCANELLAPDDLETLADIDGEDGLVLVTCENESMDGSYLNRRVVFARENKK